MTYISMIKFAMFISIVLITCNFIIGSSYARYSYTEEKQMIVNAADRSESNLFYEEGCIVVIKDWDLTENIESQQIEATFFSDTTIQIQNTVSEEYKYYFTVLIKNGDKTISETDKTKINKNKDITIIIQPNKEKLQDLSKKINAAVDFSVVLYNEDGTVRKTLYSTFVWEIIPSVKNVSDNTLTDGTENDQSEETFEETPEEIETTYTELEVEPGQTDVKIILAEVTDIFGINGTISYSNNNVVSDITATSNAGFAMGEIGENTVFLFDSASHSGEIGFTANISEDCAAGDECSIVFDYEVSDENGNMSELKRATVLLKVVIKYPAEAPKAEHIAISNKNSLTVFSIANCTEKTKYIALTAEGGFKPYTKIQTEDKIYVLPFGGEFKENIYNRENKTVKYRIDSVYDKEIPGEINISAKAYYPNNTCAEEVKNLKVFNITDTTIATAAPHGTILRSNQPIKFDIIVDNGKKVGTYTLEYYDGEKFVSAKDMGLATKVSASDANISVSLAKKYPKAGVYRLCTQVQQNNELSKIYKSFFINYR